MGRDGNELGKGREEKGREEKERERKEMGTERRRGYGKEAS
jgi:hypothetical protein